MHCYCRIACKENANQKIRKHKDSLKCMTNLDKFLKFTSKFKGMAEYLPLQRIVEDYLRKNADSSLHISEWNKLSGGSINASYIIRTSHQSFFIKCNNKISYPDLFETENKNLSLLQTNTSLLTPKVLTVLSAEDTSCLLMEYIENGTPHYDFWRDFGYGLAGLHKQTQAQFGLDYDNYIGSLKQKNTWHTKWSSFFITERLEPMLRLAFDSGKADEMLVNKFQLLYKKLDEIFPDEKPSLLHGDLWSGNFMSNMDGDPVIFDPATYYGHREMDIAMTTLFGGFDSAFYDAYQEEFPMEKNWKQRLSICNLYPLLVHVNLFVGSYIQSVRNIINPF